MFAYGMIVALATLIIDQFTKHWFLYEYALPLRGSVEVTPFFNLVTVWNRGISFGMLQSLGASNALILAAMAAGLTVMLLVWLWRTSHSFLARGIGLVIGGAVGNIIDRLRFGAVFDFIDLHLYNMHWPAFNVADAAICVGVLLILLDGFLCKENSHTTPNV